MSVATLASEPTVMAVVTSDGLLVRLSGALDVIGVPALRHALLGVRPVGCDDVVVDAGDVTAVDESALAVLLAAGTWVVDTGGRLSFARMSETLRREVAQLGLERLLPMLEPVGERTATVPMPAPRTATAT
ncbi:MAG: STAS domain-containing protein [Frankiaceae bacterium]